MDVNNQSAIIFSFKTVQTNAIRVLFESLKNILSDVNFKADSSGIKLTAVDGTTTAIVNLFLHSEKFEEYPFSDEKYGYYKTVQTNELGNTQQYSIMQNGLYGSPTNNKFGNINFSLGNILDLKIRKRKDTITKIKKIKLIESFSINSSYNIFSDSLNLSNIRISARNRFLNIIDLTFSADYDPYIANSTKTNRVNKFEIKISIPPNSFTPASTAD